MLVVNEIKYLVDGLVSTKISTWTIRKGFNTRFLYNFIAADVFAALKEKYGVAIDPVKLEKAIPNDTGAGALKDRIMKGLNNIGALTYINAYAILKNYNKGYDLYGRPMRKLDFTAMSINLHRHSRRLCALGARLQNGDDSQMNWKTATSQSLLMNVQPICSNQAFYRCPSKYNISTHIESALKVLSQNGLFEFTFSFGAIFSSVVLTAIKPKQISPVVKCAEIANPMEELGFAPVPVRSNEKYADQIEFFDKQLEELNVAIQQYDDEIFRLSGLNNKAKAERQKLINIINLLKD